MRSQSIYVGLDIGGAHVKAVGIDQYKKINLIFYEKCPIWKDFFLLKKTLHKLLKYLDSSKVTFGITITAELSDCFVNRTYGAKQIYKLCKGLGIKFYFFSLKKQNFEKRINFYDICSMNWLATGKYLEDKINEAVVIDFGSTTTDIIIIKNQKIVNRYFSDFDRINNFELIYTGFTRTPLFAIARKIVVNNNVYNLIPELFSTTADLYRVNKLLNKDLDLFDSADNRSKSKLNSLKRISRNFGFDFEKNNPLINELIDTLLEIQKNQIFHCTKKLIKQNNIKSCTPIVPCGIGQNIIENHAIKLGYKIKKFSDYLIGGEKEKYHASMHAPAVSCALLISKFID